MPSAFILYFCLKHNISGGIDNKPQLQEIRNTQVQCILNGFLSFANKCNLDAENLHRYVVLDDRFGTCNDILWKLLFQEILTTNRKICACVSLILSVFCMFFFKTNCDLDAENLYVYVLWDGKLSRVSGILWKSVFQEILTTIRKIWTYVLYTVYFA